MFFASRRRARLVKDPRSVPRSPAKKGRGGRSLPPHSLRALSVSADACGKRAPAPFLLGSGSSGGKPFSGLYPSSSEPWAGTLGPRRPGSGRRVVVRSIAAVASLASTPPRSFTFFGARGWWTPGPGGALLSFYSYLLMWSFLPSRPLVRHCRIGAAFFSRNLHVSQCAAAARSMRAACLYVYRHGVVLCCWRAQLSLRCGKSLVGKLLSSWHLGKKK